MKTILSPTDFSIASLNGVKLGANIARITGAQLHLIHSIPKSHYYNKDVHPLIGSTIPDTQITDRFKKISERNFKKMDSFQFLKNLSYRSYICHGVIENEILRYAEHISADLLIIGTHGSNGFHDSLIGSITERIIRLAKCPVLITSKDLEKPDFKKICFVSDFFSSSKPAFPFVKSFAGIFGSDIHLLKINTPDFFEPTHISKKNIRDFNDNFKTNYTSTLYNSVSITDGIHSFLLENNYDLIAIGTFHLPSYKTPFTKSLIREIVNINRVPVLSING